MAWQLFVPSNHTEIHFLEPNHAPFDLPHERNARDLQILVRAYFMEAQYTRYLLLF